jgi:hypothetical protein
MVRRRFLLSVLLAALGTLAATMLTACAAPPDKEIQQAQGAIDAAKAVGADQYAADEFAAAQTALKNAGDAVEQRDYRLALNHALDARDRAKTAAQQAADRKAAARVDADRAVGAALRAITEAQTRVKAAEAVRMNAAGARALQEARRSLAAAERSVQKARTSLDAGDYRAAIDAGKATTDLAREVARVLDGAQTAGARRRH